MFTEPFLGPALALASALSWGGGDFSGGVAARRHHPFQVLVLSTGVSLILLIGLSLGRGEGIPAPADGILAGLAGVSGALGLASLYRGLALGNAALVAPTAAVVGALFPLIVGAASEGLPAAHRLVGFGLALAGIWWVTRTISPAAPPRRKSFLYAALAGIGFGGFLALIGQVRTEAVFAPLALAKLVSFAVALLMLAGRRMSMTSPRANPVAILAGLLDAGGNVFYLEAIQYARLDVVAVLASMYPAGTVLLARGVQQERISRRQWLGLGLCLAAIGLVTL